MVVPDDARRQRDFDNRRRELLKECKLAPQIPNNVLPRLERFMAPFVERFVRSEQVEHAQIFVQGLLSDVKTKNVESIAYRFGQDRMPLQWFIGMSNWDQKPLRDELVGQVAQTLGDEDGVIVFDPSGFPKSGHESVGVSRQWCGRLGKVDNCQVAVYMGYVSRHEHALVDTRLFLPKEWTTDKKRCQKAGVPKGTRYRTRHQLCLEMLEMHGQILPHSWIAGDDELGRPYWFRRRLDRLNERFAATTMPPLPVMHSIHSRDDLPVVTMSSAISTRSPWLSPNPRRRERRSSTRSVNMAGTPNWRPIS